MTGETVDLAAVEARAEAATEGPWLLDGGPDDVKTVLGPITFGGMRVTAKTIAEYVESDADAEFIAHARTDVPAMAVELKQWRAQVAAVRALADRWRRSEYPSLIRAAAALDLVLGTGELPT